MCKSLIIIVLYGEPGGARIRDPVIKSHMLYLLSYGFIYGGAKEARTPDPLRAKQVLSQLSYNPNGGSRQS